MINRPLMICKESLLQHLFFCVAADAYSHTVRFLVRPLHMSIFHKVV